MFPEGEDPGPRWEILPDRSLHFIETDECRFHLGNVSECGTDRDRSRKGHGDRTRFWPLEFPATASGPASWGDPQWAAVELCLLLRTRHFEILGDSRAVAAPVPGGPTLTPGLREGFAETGAASRGELGHHLG